MRVKELRDLTEEAAGKAFGGIHIVRCSRPLGDATRKHPYRAYLLTFHGDTYEEARFGDLFGYGGESFDGYLGAISALRDKIVENDRQISEYWGRPTRCQSQPTA